MAQGTDLQVPKPRIAGPRFSIRAPGTHKTAVDIEVDDEDVRGDGNGDVGGNNASCTR